MENIEKLVEEAVDKAASLGASYADCRFVEIENESLSYSKGTPDSVTRVSDIGIGVRVLADGAWGFFGTSVINEKEVSRAIEKAVKIAKASAKLNDHPVELASVESYADSYHSNYKTDPFSISLNEKLGFLAELDGLMSGNAEINLRNSHIDFRKTNSYFVSTEGSKIDQILVHSGAGIEIGVSKSRHERAVRGFPQNGGQYESKGYELLTEIDFAGAIPGLTEEALALLSAPECPSKTCDLVLEGSIAGLVIHEIIGHPLELDRVFGSERNFSGTSFATADQLGEMKYGSDIINVVSDPSHKYGLASFGYDDEGVKASKVDLIKDGMLVGYLSSRETATRIGGKSSGAMRADGWGNIPIVRMTNINLLPGDKNFDEMISMVDDGIYMSTVSSWSPSDDRSSFEFGCEIAYEIKGGKLGQIYKNPTFSGNTLEFWNSVKAIGDEPSWKVWGTPNCGKGQPGQNARTAQGTAPILISGVKVGA